LKFLEKNFQKRHHGAALKEFFLKQILTANTTVLKPETGEVIQLLPTTV